MHASVCRGAGVRTTVVVVTSKSSSFLGSLRIAKVKTSLLGPIDSTYHRSACSAKIQLLTLYLVFCIILLFLLASHDTGHILSSGILILGGALLLLYLKESLMLSLFSKKISILHWFLYLCAVEIFP